MLKSSQFLRPTSSLCFLLILPPPHIFVPVQIMCWLNLFRFLFPIYSQLSWARHLWHFSLLYRNMAVLGFFPQGLIFCLDLGNFLEECQRHVEPCQSPCFKTRVVSTVCSTLKELLHPIIGFSCKLKPLHV